MRYQTVEGRVEASRPRTAAQPRAALREELMARGEEFDQFLRDEISAMAHECEVVPEPKALFHDLAPQRHRAASVATMGAALTALARNHSLPRHRLDRFLVRLTAWMHSGAVQSPESLLEAWSRETMMQAAADVTQARALSALDRQDRVALDRAIDDTAAHIAALQRLLAMQQHARSQLGPSMSAPAPRVVFLRDRCTQ